MDSNEKYIAALDVGTSNVRCIIYERDGQIKGHTKSFVKLHIPKPGFVEIDPEVLWETVLDVIHKAVKGSNITFQDIYCLAISSQRNSFILWNKETGKVYHNFITWNDIRGEEIVNNENSSIKMKLFRFFSKGLYLITRRPQFLLGSMYKLTNAQIAPRLLWVLNNNADVNNDLLKNDVAFGTIDTWLLYKFSGKSLHVTDVSNASATGLFDPFLLTWSPWPFRLFEIPKDILPKIVDSAGCHFGSTDVNVFGVSIPIHSSVADQSASLFGSGCFQRGDTKLTLGTGSFLNVNTGDTPHRSFKALYPLVAWKFDKDLVFMAEGASHDTGVILQWAKQLGLLDDVKDSEGMAYSVKHSHGVYFVPAFSGLQAPINDGTAATGFIGLKLTTVKQHLVRAMLEAIVFRVFHLFRFFREETDFHPQFIRLDGGVSDNEFVSQMLANVLNLTVKKSGNKEIAAMGAAFLAGLSSDAKNNSRPDLHRGKASASVAKDELLYDIGGCSASYPLTEKNCQNFDLSGFIILVKQTYEAIRTIEQRLDRQMPYCLFLHHCTTYLNAVFYDRIREQGGLPFGTSLRCQDAIQIDGTEYLVPEVIQEYVRNVGKIVTTTGVDVYVNIPEIARPQGPQVVEGQEVESGFFGPATLTTHNVYECYISPAVTARYVEACADEDENWKPLPDCYYPADAVPTYNLLGYDRIQRLDRAGRERCSGIFFPNDSTIDGRLKYAPELAARVNTFLSSINTKFKVSAIPKETKVRTGLSNALFVETPGRVRSGDGSPPLSYCPVNLFSFMPFGAQTANHAYLDVMHRKRTAEAPGSCYIKSNGAELAGWVANRNRNFEMSGEFSATLFVDYPFIRHASHACNPGKGRRIAAIDAWVKKLEL